MPIAPLAVRIALATILLALLATLPVRADEAKPTAPSLRIEKLTYDFKAAGKEMEYARFVPSTYDKSKKTPLVVALHGLYSNPQQIIRYPGLVDLAEKYGFIVVAPMGYNHHGWYGARALVKGSEDDPKNLSELSEQDVMNVLERTRKGYNVDPDRIYLTGHSMGGGGCWHLGVKYPEIWAALAPIAPAPVVLPTEADKIKHLPVILVQGDKDLLVKVEWVRPWAEQMKKLGMDYEYIEVKEGGHIDVAITTLPKVFEFFDKHKRGDSAPKKPEK